MHMHAAGVVVGACLSHLSLQDSVPQLGSDRADLIASHRRKSGSGDHSPVLCSRPSRFTAKRLQTRQGLGSGVADVGRRLELTVEELTICSLLLPWQCADERCSQVDRHAVLSIEQEILLLDAEGAHAGRHVL